jgi:hypothetical protein
MTRKERIQILVGHTDQHIKAQCKKLPLFEPHDLRSVISEAQASEADSGPDQAVVLALRRRNQLQLIDLLRRLGIDPSQSDAFKKGFLQLALNHYGVGRLAWHRPRTNRNAAIWTANDDLNLLMEVTRLKAIGLSELQAIQKIASNPQTRRLFPYRQQQDRSDFHSSALKKKKKLQAALWRRLQHLKASSTENSILKQLLGPCRDARGFFVRLLYAFDFPMPLPKSVMKNKRPSQ